MGKPWGLWEREEAALLCPKAREGPRSFILPAAQQRSHSPKLGTDLVAALASLNVDDLTAEGARGESQRKARTGRQGALS
jgi:hypothetical protein